MDTNPEPRMNTNELEYKKGICLVGYPTQGSVSLRACVFSTLHTQAETPTLPQRKMKSSETKQLQIIQGYLFNPPT